MLTRLVIYEKIKEIKTNKRDKMKTFTSMKKAEQFIKESGYCSLYLFHKSKYRVFKTLEDHDVYSKANNI